MNINDPKIHARITDNSKVSIVSSRSLSKYKIPKAMVTIPNNSPWVFFLPILSIKKNANIIPGISENAETNISPKSLSVKTFEHFKSFFVSLYCERLRVLLLNS